MPKLLIIGIDGMDAIQLSKFERNLPNFSKMKNNNSNVQLKSIFPPDSIPAWGTIYTGLNPAEHGVINFLDPKQEELKIKFTEIYKSYVGKTFWDIASMNGKKVCILLPYSIFPPWPVNGIMVCRSLEVVNENFPLKTFPKEVFEDYNLHEINVNLFHGFPSKKNYGKFIESCRKRTLQEAELGLRFLKNFDADMYFLYFSALDAIQHTFWSYCDENHPDYPGENKYENIIQDFYRLMDDIIGRIIGSIDSTATVIVLSDHGHGMRPINIVNINEILRQTGYLSLKNNKIQKLNPFEHKETIKKVIISLIEKFGINNFILKFIESFPFVKKSLITTDYIDWSASRAYLSSISGIKSYSQGGIVMSSQIDINEYELCREDIIKILSEISNPVKSELLINWICKREDLYLGEFIYKYPDIVFELKEGYGVGWDINQSVIGKSQMRRFQPGSHLQDSAIIMFNRPIKLASLKEKMDLMDISKLILQI